MYKLSFYVPKSHAEQTKNAIFAAGGGRIGNYDCCAFETVGRGQFRALEGSSPFIGQQNQVEFVEELKIEMVCDDSLIEKVVKALKESHPYETPAYDVVKCAPF